MAGDLDGILHADHVATRGDRERVRFLWASVMASERHLHIIGGVVTDFAVVRSAHFFARDLIDILAVNPAARRSGIGSGLLRHALATAATARAFTSTNSSNFSVRALLVAEDWSFSGELDGLDNGDPELVFYKTVAVTSAVRAGEFL